MEDMEDIGLLKAIKDGENGEYVNKTVFRFYPGKMIARPGQYISHHGTFNGRGRIVPGM